MAGNNDSRLQRRVKATSCQPGTIVTIEHQPPRHTKTSAGEREGRREPRTHEDSELIKTVTQNSGNILLQWPHPPVTAAIVPRTAAEQIHGRKSDAAATF